MARKLIYEQLINKYMIQGANLAIELCSSVLALVLVVHVLLQHAVNVIGIPAREQRVEERHEEAVQLTPETRGLTIGHGLIGIGRGVIYIVGCVVVVWTFVIVGDIRCGIVIGHIVVIGGNIVIIIIRCVVVVGCVVVIHIVVGRLWHTGHNVHCAHWQETSLISVAWRLDKDRS